MVLPGRRPLVVDAISWKAHRKHAAAATWLHCVGGAGSPWPSSNAHSHGVHIDCLTWCDCVSLAGAWLLQLLQAADGRSNSRFHVPPQISLPAAAAGMHLRLSWHAADSSSMQCSMTMPLAVFCFALKWGGRVMLWAATRPEQGGKCLVRYGIRGRQETGRLLALAAPLCANGVHHSEALVCCGIQYQAAHHNGGWRLEQAGGASTNLGRQVTPCDSNAPSNLTQPSEYCCDHTARMV